MPDPLDKLSSLARRARAEEPYIGSTAGTVLARLEGEAAAPQRPVLAFAGATLALTLVLLLGMVISASGPDPLLAFFDGGLGLNQWGWS